MYKESTIVKPLPWQTRLHLLWQPHVVRQAMLAAVLVGTILVLLNQGDVLFSGNITGTIVIKSLCTPLIPFCVTMLGAFLNTSSAGGAGPRPGWAAVKRSGIIAVVVGGIIIALNQGDVLLAGSIPAPVWLKIALTPCVPFCVSLYGAYVAYRSAQY